MGRDGIDGLGREVLRERILEVLDWAAAVFRPGTHAHGELAGLAVRLRDPGIRLSPMAGEDERLARRALAAMARDAEALRGALERLGGEGELDPAAAAALAAGVAAMKDGFSRVVTYRQITDALAGSWGDSDLGEAIASLSRDLSPGPGGTHRPARAVA